MTSSRFNKKILACGVAVLLASGCSKAPPEEVYTVSWYEGHSEARSERLKRCEENLGTEGRSPNCVNALEAMLKSQNRPNQKSVADGIKLQ